MAKSYYPPMHTAEHILNQTMLKLFTNERSFSNHLERKKSKCDYHFSRNLTEDETKTIQKRVNEIISSNLDVTESFLNRNDAMKLYSLSKLPNDAGENVRVISIGDYDSCLCIGEHVNNTSEIGEFRIVSTSYNDGVLRIRFKLDNPV